MEKRIVAHCMFIHKNATAIQADRKVRAKLWKFDDNSYIYWTREEKKVLKKKVKVPPVV
jgi:hypothetical protein